MNDDDLKVSKYQEVLRSSLTDIYSNLEKRMKEQPGDFLDSNIPEQLRLINDINAVESEWILDDELRREISLLGDPE